MAKQIKDVGTLSKKFVQRASAAAPDYADGVKNAGQAWADGAGKAGDNYSAGVQAAITDKRYQRGVQDAGPQRYTEKASTLGAQRFPTGVGQAANDWAKGVQPHLDALRNLDLPPRGPKGSPQNQQRAQAVAMKLRAIKEGR